MDHRQSRSLADSRTADHRLRRRIILRHRTGVFGIIELRPLSLLLSAAAVYVLRDRCRTDSYKQLVLDLDSLNGLFVLGLAVGLMVFG